MNEAFVLKMKQQIFTELFYKFNNITFLQNRHTLIV